MNPEQITPTVDDQRAAELLRLDRLRDDAWRLLANERARDVPDAAIMLDAITALTTISNQRCLLLGLYPPRRVQLEVNGHEIEIADPGGGVL
jgi:hypothetical protein